MTMKKTNCTKLTALLIILALLCALFTACSQDNDSSRTGPDVQSSQPSDIADTGAGEKPTLTVLADFPERNPGGDIHGSLMDIPGIDDYELRMEYVPNTEPDRANYITRANVELMSGKGADVFLVDCYMGNLLESVEGPLFNYPQKLMENRIFLPLDGYMENAQFTEFDKLLPIVMEAGRNGEGQQILPMTFVLTAATCLKEGYDLPDPVPATHEDMLASGDPLLDCMARPQTNNLLMYLGQPADFVEEELSFTEDELFDLAMEYYGMVQTSRTGGYDSISGYEWENGCRRGTGAVLDYYLFGTGSGDDQVMVIAGPNRTGGVTAGIGSYGAVNRNTEHPDMAFAVLDRLLSRNNQRSNNMYGLLTGMPMDVEVGSFDNRFTWGNPWHMNDWNFQQYVQARDKIDAVKFYTPLDREAEITLAEACQAEDASEDSIRRAVHSTYTTMKMMLAES